MEVMPAPLFGARLDVGSRRGEDPLPDEGASGRRALAGERIGQLDPPCPFAQIAGVEFAHAPKLVTQRGERRAWQKGRAIFAPLAAANEDLPPLEVEVFDPQAAALEKPQARSVHDQRHQRGRPVQLSKHAHDFRTREHHGQALRALRVDNVVEPIVYASREPGCSNDAECNDQARRAVLR